MIYHYSNDLFLSVYAIHMQTKDNFPINILGHFMKVDDCDLHSYCTRTLLRNIILYISPLDYNVLLFIVMQ